MNTLTIKSLKDINSREAVALAQSLTPVSSEIYLYVDDRRVNAKSILGLLSLSIKKDDILNFDIIDDNEYEITKRIITQILEQ